MTDLDCWQPNFCSKIIFSVKWHTKQLYHFEICANHLYNVLISFQGLAIQSFYCKELCNSMQTKELNLEFSMTSPVC